MNIGITNAGEKLVAIIEALYEQELEVRLIHDKEGAGGIYQTLAGYSKTTNPAFDVAFGPTGLKINGQRVGISTEERLVNVPWDLYHVEIVEDFDDKPRSEKILMGNIELYDNSQCDIKLTSVRHIISSPSIWINPKADVNPGINLVMGVNHRRFDPSKHRVIGSPNGISSALLVAMNVIRNKRYSIESVMFKAYEDSDKIEANSNEAKDVIPYFFPKLKPQKVMSCYRGVESLLGYKESITGGGTQTHKARSFTTLKIIATGNDPVSTEQLHSWLKDSARFYSKMLAIDEGDNQIDQTRFSIVLPETRVIDSVALGDGKVCYEGFGPYLTTFQIKVSYDNIRGPARNQAMLTKHIIDTVGRLK